MPDGLTEPIADICAVVELTHRWHANGDDQKKLMTRNTSGRDVYGCAAVSTAPPEARKQHASLCGTSEGTKA